MILSIRTPYRFNATICLASIFCASAFAGTISFSPDVKSVAPASHFTLDLVASGLSIGAFDLDVHFDGNLVTLNSIAFDSFLGAPLSIQSSTINSSSSNIAETSFLVPADLDALQTTPFRLASFSFEALKPGLSHVTISANAIADSGGATIAADLGSAVIVVEGDSDGGGGAGGGGGGTSVPEPRAGALAGLLTVLLVWRRHAIGALVPTPSSSLK